MQNKLCPTHAVVIYWTFYMKIQMLLINKAQILKPILISSCHLRSRVQKFPAWHTKAAPNGKMLWGIYSAIYGEVNV